jgi:hypothetical protein
LVIVGLGGIDDQQRWFGPFDDMAQHFPTVLGMERDEDRPEVRGTNQRDREVESVPNHDADPIPGINAVRPHEASGAPPSLCQARVRDHPILEHQSTPTWIAFGARFDERGNGGGRGGQMLHPPSTVSVQPWL